MSIQEFLNYNFIHFGDFQLNLFQLMVAIIILLLGRLITRIFQGVLKRYLGKRSIDAGRQYAFSQFLKYIIYTATILIALEAMGISVSILWGGAAALLVGIGLGLQQTFNDLLSGIILLMEGSVEVGDIIEVEGIVGEVMAIDIRTSRIETRDQISILIPNSKIAGDKAINWSHNKKPTRFHITVGVAYASDIDKVTTLLLAAADQNKEVLQTPPPRVQFRDFGNSSLDFILYFHAYEYLQIEFIKSEIRYEITRAFRRENVEIPFPQRDLWLRSPIEIEA